MKFLITGFDPFGGEEINPSWEVVKRLENKISDYEIIKLELPTVFGKSADILREAIEKHKPTFILSLGQAGSREDISIERVAINQDDARISDNMGQSPIDEIIRRDGENAYFSNLPIKAIVENIKKAGIKASVSNTAGTFVCNHIMYQALYFVNKYYPNIKAGFIHIPYLPSQVVNKVELASMQIEDMIKGISIAIETIIEYAEKEDKKISGGRED